jgi:hypothetical protein
MKKIVIPTILAATVLVAGFVAYLPVQKAQTVHTFLADIITGNVEAIVAASVRDNIIVEEANLFNVTDRMVILDNAGIGSTSDVEITWRFGGDADCRIGVILGAGGVISASPGPAPGGGVLAGDDGAFGGNPPHADATNVEAVFIINVGGDDDVCDFDTIADGGYVSVSTINAP